MQLHVLEPLFTIFYTFVCKNFYSRPLKFPGKIAESNTVAYSSTWTNFGTVKAPKICQ